MEKNHAKLRGGRVAASGKQHKKNKKKYLWSLLMNSMRCYQNDPLLWILKKADFRYKTRFFLYDCWCEKWAINVECK